MSGHHEVESEDDVCGGSDETGASKQGSHSALLPTIVINGDVNKVKKPLKSPTNDAKMWSNYHRDCMYEVEQNKLPPVRPERRIPRLTPRRRRDTSVTDYLDKNRQYLEAYVMDSVPVDELKEWLIKKMTKKLTFKVDGHNKAPNCKERYMDIIKSFQEVSNELSVVRKIADLVSTSLCVEAFRVYKIFPDHPSFVQYFVMDKNPELTHLIRAEPEDTKHVLQVVQRGNILRLSKHLDASFPNIPRNILTNPGLKETELNHVLYQPILNDSGKTVYVIELWKTKRFDERDEEMCSNFVIWNSLTLRYCNSFLEKTLLIQEHNMSGFLLEVIKAIFEDMETLDHVIKRILEFVQKLVNADRASLFLIDYKKSELVSPLFDIKYDPEQGINVEKAGIRMPLNHGIAGYVAQSGETMNIPDAYSDYRFNRNVDEVTGYKTVSILCMPVKVEGKIIGVVQMVNKRNNSKFDHEDEVAFETFASFFGLALQHAKLYDKILRKEQKYRVALEVLSYHNTCKENEVEEILKNNEKLNINMEDFYLDPYMFDDFQKCKAALIMFDDLFDLSNFDKISVTRFILTVRKNYRKVPYHNFDHGWSVANAMYVILKNDDQKRFNYKMRLALFVACLCHDLDHRGYTNKYLNETASPLAAMYTTSPLEHHHFNITVKILQEDGHYIFSHLSSEEYHDILTNIKHCILATDLAVFFPNLEKIQEKIDVDGSPIFDWQEPNNSKLAMAISMTAADLSASTKPWDIQNKTVKVIFEEFYEQGDKEKAAGKTPIPMMDRSKPEERPASQVGFLSQICVPCYNILYKILPNTKPMYEMVLKNLSIWESLAKRVLKIDETQLGNDDTLASISDTELDVNSIDTDDSNDIQLPLTSLNDGVTEKAIISQSSESKIKKTLQSIQSDSVSWDEEQNEKVKKVSEIWKVVPAEDLADEEGTIF